MNGHKVENIETVIFYIEAYLNEKLDLDAVANSMFGTNTYSHFLCNDFPVLKIVLINFGRAISSEVDTLIFGIVGTTFWTMRIYFAIRSSVKIFLKLIGFKRSAAILTT